MAKKKAAGGDSLGERLREAVRASGRTHYRIGKQAGIRPDVIDRFMRGTDIRISTASKIAEVLGYELTKRQGG